MPAKLSARARLFDTGHNRKTDAHDAHAVAVVAVRTKGLRVLSYDDELEALRMLVDRREELTRARVQTRQPAAAAAVRADPRQGEEGPDRLAGQGESSPRCGPATWPARPARGSRVEQLTELVAVDKKIKALTKELKAMVLASGSTLMDLPGVGPVVAARILADVGDVARFADRNRFASWTGTAPIEASSGEIVRHRLSRAGNRRMNHMIHIAAATQIRLDTPGRAYYRRKLAAGKTRAEAMRCLKRRISDALYRQLLADARAAGAGDAETGPGGHCGASHESSAAGLHPHIDTSDQPLPGPAHPTLPRDHATPGRATARKTLQPALDNRGVPM